MRIFVIGDVQGCCADLQAFCTDLQLRAQDELWLCGDLINRGPDSLQTLRWLRDYPGKLRCVLGNHDLAVLAQARGAVDRCGSTARALLAATDGPELLAWLQGQDLLVHEHGLLMVHAGLPPAWTVEQTQQEAAALQQALRGAQAQALFASMYGDKPTAWDPKLQGQDRLRYTVNALTRMRYVDADGRLELQEKLGPTQSQSALLPWFQHPLRRSKGQPIAFGHWSTLGRNHWAEQDVWGLDDGCVWGGRLTALEWPARRLLHRHCPSHRQPG